MHKQKNQLETIPLKLFQSEAHTMHSLHRMHAAPQICYISLTDVCSRQRSQTEWCDVNELKQANTTTHTHRHTLTGRLARNTYFQRMARNHWKHVSLNLKHPSNLLDVLGWLLISNEPNPNIKCKLYSWCDRKWKRSGTKLQQNDEEKNQPNENKTKKKLHTNDIAY